VISADEKTQHPSATPSSHATIPPQTRVRTDDGGNTNNKRMGAWLTWPPWTCTGPRFSETVRSRSGRIASFDALGGPSDDPAEPYLFSQAGILDRRQRLLPRCQTQRRAPAGSLTPTFSRPRPGPCHVGLQPIEIYFSIIQPQGAYPNDFDCLRTLADALHARAPL
jgi:hypothetical protein